MSLFKYKNIPFFLKKILAYTVYLFTALIACFFAFSLVVNFLSLSFSEEQGNPPPQKKEVGFKDIFRDILKNLKTLLSGLSKEKEDSNKREGSQVVESKEVLSSPEKNNKQAPPPVPESFEGQDYGNTIQPAKPVSEGVVQEPVVPPVSEGVVQEPVVPPVSEGVVQEPVVPPVSEGVVQEPVAPPASEVIVQEPVAPPASEVIVQEPVVPPASEVIVQEPVAPPASEVIVQEPVPRDIPASAASLEVQSYMAPFVYDSVNQKDPFEDPTYKPATSFDERLGDEAVVFVSQTPPEVYNLDEIKLKGIIWNNKTPKALFELPNSGGYYSLIRGDKIGKNGVLFEIRESEVVVVETNIIGKGESKREERVIKIKKINRIDGK